MKELWQACRLLSNPKRLSLLRRTYALKEVGLGVNEATDRFELGQSAISQYFKQLLEVGLVRRERGGRLVGYYADWSKASASIGEIAQMLYDRFAAGGADTRFSAAFAVFGNAFRLRAIRHVAKRDWVSKEELAQVFKKPIRFITRDLEPAVKAGLLDLDSGDDLGRYRYLPPADPIAQHVVALRG